MSPDQIERFLKIAQWFRTRFLMLETPNVKEKNLFSEETILSLPSWVNSDEIDIPIQPFEEKLQEFYKALKESPAFSSTRDEKKWKANESLSSRK